MPRSEAAPRRLTSGCSIANALSGTVTASVRLCPAHPAPRLLESSLQNLDSVQTRLLNQQSVKYSLFNTEGLFAARDFPVLSALRAQPLHRALGMWVRSEVGVPSAEVPGWVLLGCRFRLLWYKRMTLRLESPLRSPGPTITPTPPCLLNHVPKGHIQTVFEPLQGWGLPHCPGQGKSRSCLRPRRAAACSYSQS